MKRAVVVLCMLFGFVMVGCAGELVNLDPKFAEIDARITQVENDFNVYKSSTDAILATMYQDILNFMPPGFVLCIISTDTAHNWEVKYPSDTIKVDYIENVILP